MRNLLSSRERTLRFAVVFLFAFIFGFAAVMIVHFSFPAKYFYDGHRIQRLISLVSNITRSSYQNTAYIYKAFGFSSYSSFLLAGLWTFVISYIFVCISLSYGKTLLSAKFLVIFFVFVFLMCVYLGQFSKEFVVIVMVSSMLYFSKYSRILFIPLLVMVFSLYAYYFRIYWFIVLYILIVFYLSELIRNVKFKIVFVLIGFIVPFVAAGLMGIHLTDARTHLNLYRIGSQDAITILMNPFSNTGIVTDIANSFIMLLSLVIPVPIMFHLGIKYFAFMIWEILLVILIVKSVILFRRIRLPISIKRRYRFSLYVVFSFILVQSLFEPDYGSFLKHQIGVLPLYLFIVSNYFYFKWKFLRRDAA